MISKIYLQRHDSHSFTKIANLNFSILHKQLSCCYARLQFDRNPEKHSGRVDGDLEDGRGLDHAHWNVVECFGDVVTRRIPESEISNSNRHDTRYCITCVQEGECQTAGRLDLFRPDLDAAHLSNNDTKEITKRKYSTS